MRGGASGFTLLRLLDFLLLAVVAQFKSQMGGNRFALAVRVRRQIDRIRRRCQLLQLGNDFLFARNNHVIGLEVVRDIYTERALGQVPHVPERGLDGESLTQIFLDRFRLGWGLDDD